MSARRLAAPLLGLVGLTALVLAGPPQPRKVALLIGVQDYRGTTLSDLKYAENDVQELAQILQAQGYGDNVILMTQSEAYDRKQRNLFPTAANIRLQLTGLLEELREEDTLLLAFAGHGVHLKQLRDQGLHFCPLEANLDRVETLVSLAEVYEQLEKNCQAGVKLLVVDACRNDPLDGRSVGDERLESVTRPMIPDPPGGVAVFFSCSTGQKAFESETLKHGIFFHYFIQGLKGEAAYRDGEVTVPFLEDYLARTVPVAVKKERGDPTVRQVPERKGALRGSVVLACIPTAPRDLRPQNVQPMPNLPKTIQNSLGMSLVRIDPGSFIMGSEETPEQVAAAFEEHAESFRSEHPAHPVRISRSFYLAACEVTNGQFQQFIDDTGYRTDLETQAGLARSLNPNAGEYNAGKEDEKSTWKTIIQGLDVSERGRHPVVLVSWQDADAFCAWLSRKEGRTYRLPNEAEWEYACRGGTTTRYWCGNDPEGLVQIANVPDVTFLEILNKKPGYATLKGRDGYASRAPVGSFKPNPFGLYDMHGNVWEWCLDQYNSAYYSRGVAVDPPGPEDGDERVIRGGCFM